MYRTNINGVYKTFSNVYDWFKAHAAQELKINSKYYIDIKYFGKAIWIQIREKESNKLIKTIYKNLDITKDWIKKDDKYYFNDKYLNESIKNDISFTLDELREFYLDSIIIDEIKEINTYENTFDDIRNCLI
jgi:hypothetical protein